MGCLGTVICALISTIFIVYITEINPDMMFLLAALLKKRNWLKKNNHKKTALQKSSAGLFFYCFCIV